MKKEKVLNKYNPTTGTQNKNLQTNYKRKDYPICKKWVEDLNRNFKKEEIQMATIRKRCSASQVIRQMQIIITMRCHQTSTRSTNTLYLVIPDASNDVEQLSIHTLFWLEWELIQPLWETVFVLSNNASDAHTL